MRSIHTIITLFIAPLISLGLYSDAFAASQELSSQATILARANVSNVNEGVSFSCDANRLTLIKANMGAYLASLGINESLIVSRIDSLNGALIFTLNTPQDDSETLLLKQRPEYAIRDSIVQLIGKSGKVRKVVTVSKKEILLALLQHGRLTEFSGVNCDLNVLKQQINIRQNIVAWSENLNWVWPDGGPAEWNEKYWHRGTPLPNVTLSTAFSDVFNNQHKYAIGCYTAAKLVMVHGALDYYHRVNRNEAQQKRFKDQLMSDQDPLVDVEPGRMWSFEKDYDPKKLSHPGKILTIQYHIAPRNFVPGDWAYMVNTDPVSSMKTGYEGSNAIYLGRNKFVDFYNDNHHAYTYQQKLDGVYQWRNGVFSRSRDFAKIKPLSKGDYEQLSKSPLNGGLVLDFRVYPIIF